MQVSKIFFLLIFLILIFSENCFAYTSEKDTSYTTYQTFQKIRKNHPEIRMVEELKSNEINQFENLTYKTITDGADLRALHLDIYRPKQFGKYPAIVLIHGGGWRSGNKSMERPMAQRIAMQGYVAIPVEYRLSLEAKYPAAIHDIKAAIRFVKDNAERYGIDTSKIAIEGESAGGQLATLVAMTNNVAKFDGEKSGS
ncbi:MAG TPA: alpha/beta hydrolase, partial [Paludibacter sp.]|nr:alpha/beta hydrolase [Paludibacter sp.]